MAPFRAIFKGVIAPPQDADMTQTGQVKRFFDLVDPSGLWFHCCAMGKNASSKDIQSGREVVLYFGKGMAAAGSSPGAVYIMRDALIVGLRQKGVPCKTRQMCLT